MGTPHESAPSLAGRLDELARLLDYLESDNLTVDAVRAHVAERIEVLLPVEYHVYRRRWQALLGGTEPGPLLPFPEWQALTTEMEEIDRLAEMLDEPAEGQRWDALRRLLLVADESDLTE